MEKNSGKVKLNTKVLLIIALIVFVCTILFAGLSSFVKKNNLTTNGLAEKQFNEISEADYNTQSDKVKFMAYFLQDGKKVDGTNTRIGYSNIMYFDLQVQDGKLNNPTIQIDSKNFYLETNLMNDSTISQNYVSKILRK